MFIPILARISIPFNIEENAEEQVQTKLQEKEVKAKEHLEEMFEITRQLSYTDIEMLNRNRANAENEIERQGRERE